MAVALPIDIPHQWSAKVFPLVPPPHLACVTDPGRHQHKHGKLRTRIPGQGVLQLLLQKCLEEV